MKTDWVNIFLFILYGIIGGFFYEKISQPVGILILILAFKYSNFFKVEKNYPVTPYDDMR